MMSRNMTEAPLPKRVDGVKLVDVNQELNGIIDSKQLTRLTSATVSCSEQIPCHVEFSRDSERHRILSGKCSTEVVLECQRCLEDVSFAIESSFELALVFNDEQAKKLPRRLEPAELDEDGRMDLWEVIEDEILLNLPDFPMHPQGQCKAHQTESEENIAEEAKRPNPFDVLAKLKQK